MGHSFRFSTSFRRIRCDRKFPPPVIRRGEEEESVDRTRIGASAVTCARIASVDSLHRSFCTCYFLFFFHPSGRSARTYLPTTLLFAPFLFPTVSHFRVLSGTNVKINVKKKRARAGMLRSSKPSFILPFD